MSRMSTSFAASGSTSNSRPSPRPPTTRRCKDTTDQCGCWHGWSLMLVAGSGVFAGLNTMYGAVVGTGTRIGDVAGDRFSPPAQFVLTLIQEATLLACTRGSRWRARSVSRCVNGAAVRFTMGAFMLRVDSVGIAVACGVAILLGIVGCTAARTGKRCDYRLLMRWEQYD